MPYDSHRGNPFYNKMMREITKDQAATVIHGGECAYCGRKLVNLYLVEGVEDWPCRRCKEEAEAIAKGLSTITPMQHHFVKAVSEEHKQSFKQFLDNFDVSSIEPTGVVLRKPDVDSFEQAREAARTFEHVYSGRYFGVVNEKIDDLIEKGLVTPDGRQSCLQRGDKK